MRNFGTYKRSPRARQAGVGFDQNGPVVTGDAPGGILEVDRHFTPTATKIAPTKRVYVQLEDEAGNPDGFRREVFDARD